MLKCSSQTRSLLNHFLQLYLNRRTSVAADLCDFCATKFCKRKAHEYTIVFRLLDPWYKVSLSQKALSVSCWNLLMIGWMTFYGSAYIIYLGLLVIRFSPISILATVFTSLLCKQRYVWSSDYQPRRPNNANCCGKVWYANLTQHAPLFRFRYRTEIWEQLASVNHQCRVSCFVVWLIIIMDII